MRYTGGMQSFAVILSIFACTLLVTVAAMRPRRSSLSLYELERREHTKNPAARAELRREILITDVISVLRVIGAVLMVLTVVAAIGAFGMILGAVVSVSVAILYGRSAKIEAVRLLADRVYEHFEPALLRFVELHPKLCEVVRSTTSERVDYRPASREELEHMIDNSGAVLKEGEKKLLLSNLHFGDKRVEEVMTPRGVITAIKHDTLIGPLTLSDLHQTGHERFPVYQGDIDHIVGLLYIHDLVTLSNKESKTAEALMEGKVFYIEQTQTLREALAAFLHVKHHLFVVINEYRETAGIITLEDVIEAMIGQKIIDEFDVHDDMRLVAERSAKLNNNTPNGTSV